MALRVELEHPLRGFVASVALAVPAGRTLALVGPSGAGKTTVLRVVAGLLRPRRGRVEIGGSVVLDTARGRDLPPERRRVGYVFQEYALFPHLDAYGNVRFGAEGRERAEELLDRFRIGHLAKAKVGDLSGGERQRVALARALARDPDVLLLDEPLSALDAHTRVEVRAELRELLASLGLPTLLVTHDFEDAAALADEVGVLSDGRVLQLGTPTDLVSRPGDPFVATFAGATLLAGQVVATENGLTEVRLDGGLSVWSADPASGPVDVALYPWDVSVGLEPHEDSQLNHVTAPVASVASIGNRTRVRVGPLVAEVTSVSSERLGLAPGTVVTASFKATAARLFPR
jgi:molybdate transport system ATP-binding protein